MALQRDLVDANRLERCGPGTQRTHRHLLDAIDNPAQPIEIVHVPLKPFAGWLHGMWFEGCIRHTVLVKDIHDGDFSTKGVTAVFGLHFVQIIGISLNQDGDAGIFECGNRTGLIPKVGQAQNHAIVFPMVLTQPVCVKFSFPGGLHRAIRHGIFRHHQYFVALLLEHAREFLTGFLHEEGREEGSVSEEQCER